MKLLLVLLAIIALACANPFNTPLRSQIIEGMQKFQEVGAHYKKSMEGLSNVHQHLKNNHEEFIKAISQPVVAERSTRVISQTCSNALNNLTFSLECQGYVTAFYTGADISVKSNAVDNYCSICSTNIEQQIKAILVNCSRDDIGIFKARFFQLGYYNRFLCSKEGGNFCAKTLLNVNQVILAKSFDQVTSNDLNQVCSACVLKALRISIAGGSNNIGSLALYASLRVVCVQIKGEYCILKFKAASDASNKLFSSGTAPSSNDIKNFLDIVCYPCFRAIFSRIVAIGDISQGGAVSTIGGIFGKLCRKDQSKTYCLVRLYDSVKNLLTSQSTGDVCGSGNTPECTASCKDLIRKLIGNGGCCWALFVDFISDSGAGSAAIDEAKRQFYAFVESCAGIKIPPPCPSVANGTLIITYVNLDISVINSNVDAFKALVLQDLRGSFGGLDSYVNINVAAGISNKRAGTTTTNVTITGAAVPGTAAGSLTDTAVTCDAVCLAVPPNDPSTDVTVSNRATDVKVQSASSSLSVSFVLLAGLFVLQFFF